ncbi:uncharacterized protein LOC110807798 [Carica papaya]|uniref:uncharacterized protein LOC110807798 n=1 Tax=Carica papaya TaxID=3649 RepID=UPI000B8C6E6E|nr:uncharacterized protein LOC110807798 [Carica papaya]
MDCTLKMISSIVFPINSSSKLNFSNQVLCWSPINGNGSVTKICAVSNGAVPSSASHGAESGSARDAHKRRSNLESLFCYDKPIPEERIEKPVGLSLVEKAIGDNPHCIDCEAKGAVLCATCSGSGLYVDSILRVKASLSKSVA